MIVSLLVISLLWPFQASPDTLSGDKLLVALKEFETPEMSSVVSFLEDDVLNGLDYESLEECVPVLDTIRNDLFSINPDLPILPRLNAVLDALSWTSRADSLLHTPLDRPAIAKARQALGSTSSLVPDCVRVKAEELDGVLRRYYLSTTRYLDLLNSLLENESKPDSLSEVLQAYLSNEAYLEIVNCIPYVRERVAKLCELIKADQVDWEGLRRERDELIKLRNNTTS